MLTKAEMPVACSDNELGVINSSVYAGGRKVTDVAIEEAGDWSKRPGHVVWIGLFEPSDELLKRVQQQFDLHPLAIDDAGTPVPGEVGGEEVKEFSLPHDDSEPTKGLAVLEDGNLDIGNPILRERTYHEVGCHDRTH